MINEINADRIKRSGSSVFLLLDGPAPPLWWNKDRYNNDVGIRDRADYKHVVETYKDYWCRRCHTYYCNYHGIEQPYPRKRVDPPAPFLCPVPLLSIPSDNIRRGKNNHNKKGIIPDNTNYNGQLSIHDIPYKFYANSNDGEGGALKDYEKSMIIRWNSMLRDDKNKFEVIAKMLGHNTNNN